MCKRFEKNPQLRMPLLFILFYGNYFKLLQIYKYVLYDLLKILSASESGSSKSHEDRSLRIRIRNPAPLGDRFSYFLKRFAPNIRAM
jgi:hypothetical protein